MKNALLLLTYRCLVFSRKRTVCLVESEGKTHKIVIMYTLFLGEGNPLGMLLGKYCRLVDVCVTVVISRSSMSIVIVIVSLFFAHRYAVKCVWECIGMYLL